MKYLVIFLLSLFSAVHAEDENITTSSVLDTLSSLEFAEQGLTKTLEVDSELEELEADISATLEQLYSEEVQSHQKQILKLRQENELALQKIKNEIVRLTAESERLELQNEVFEQKKKRILAKIESEREKLSLENELREQLLRRKELNDLFDEIKEPEYLANPVIDGKLVVSDRRIVLDEVISSQTTDFVTKYIHFYNNKSTEYPIFIVIEQCMGGSVMEGARILEVMKHSEAPVYVLVKSFAGSMGAIITALAERSFAYPNALIVHHQMSGFAMGNTTQLDESLKFIQQWSKRLLAPVAEKMGVTLDEFIKSMYQHSAEGDWIEFASDAKKLGWVDEIVEGVQEKSYTHIPDDEELEEVEIDLQQVLIDAQGRVYSPLPRLVRGDFYHIYNPDNYYRW
ncbi:ATP-dependent Clp protease proteolytic subunit [Candidatus Albibeggiatoa sp. nov. NOAA]|uniref:ClpP family protease n=1 Tax=Candidatus Albibeggiatoa sp. nov. NOAA TaxID=3162724 RepID=UPI0032FF22A4|nr:ATP-dependent Clp protease proteolytic subunit [Thiotrichaceae bacterium]